MLLTLLSIIMYSYRILRKPSVHTQWVLCIAGYSRPARSSCVPRQASCHKSVTNREALIRILPLFAPRNTILNGMSATIDNARSRNHLPSRRREREANENTGNEALGRKRETGVDGCLGITRPQRTVPSLAFALVCVYTI